MTVWHRNDFARELVTDAIAAGVHELRDVPLGRLGEVLEDARRRRGQLPSWLDPSNWSADEFVEVDVRPARRELPPRQAPRRRRPAPAPAPAPVVEPVLPIATVSEELATEPLAIVSEPEPTRPPDADSTKERKRLRELARSKRAQPVRAVSIRTDRVSKRAREDLAREVAELYPADVQRPRDRRECRDGPRPCPFVSCAHHLYLDVNPRTGSVKLNFPDLEPDELEESCALDVADRGAATLDRVAALANVTRERVHQLEVSTLERIRKRRHLPVVRELEELVRDGDLFETSDGPTHPLAIAAAE